MAAINSMEAILANGINNVGDGNNRRPVGYIRAKLFNRNILVKTLIDGGNMFGSLISEELAKVMKVQVRGRAKSVGTAAKHSTVTVLGKATKPVKLFLEGVDRAVTFQPYVVRNLAHPINLGECFLRDIESDQMYRKKGVWLRIHDNCVGLAEANLDLTKPSIDARFQNTLDKFNLQGRNPWSGNAEILDLRVNNVPDNHQPEHPDEDLAPEEEEEVPGVYYQDHKQEIEWSETRTRIYNPEPVHLPARHTTVVKLNLGKPGRQAQNPVKINNDVLIVPKMTQDWMNKHEVFLQPGVVTRQGPEIRVFITNFSDEDHTMPAGCHLGHILEADSYTQHHIAAVSGQAKKVSQEELSNRRQFIIQQLNLNDNPTLTQDPKAMEGVIQIFLEGWEAVSTSETDFGKTDAMKFYIQLEPGAKPVRDRVRPLNPMQEADLRRQIDEWLEAGVIEPSNSAWTSALVPCKKKGTDKFRWAIDYRRLNTLTIKDAYPLASIETNLHKLSGTQYFSTLDSAGAFHTIPIHEEHRDYTAFGTPFGQYRFVRLPFGLANAPSAYSRLVQMALDQLPPGFAMGYIDDIIIHSADLQEHLHHLREVVQLHVRMGMKLNMRKCNLIKSEVEYLGHLVSKDSIRMIPSYVERILDWPLPSTGKELRSFLGFTGYYRSFIKEYSHLTAEMNKDKMKQTLDWTPETTAKFEKLKSCFKAQPLRGYPQYDNPEPFILDTDYSSSNMAAVLSQKQRGQEVFLGCAAKKCNPAETRYPPHKGELAAVLLGLKKFEHILRAKPFIIRTDSKCVEFVNTMKEFRGVFARWHCFLSSFKYTLVHRAGKKNQNADPLSRRPGLPEEHEVQDPCEYLHDVDDIYAVLTEETPAVKELTHPGLQKATREDDVLHQIRDFVEKGEKPDKEQRKGLSSVGMSYVNVFECLTTEDQLLYYTPPKVNGQESNRLICLPTKMYNAAFDWCHRDPMNGHFGMNNTFAKMSDRFYFPYMYAFISARINNCVRCISKRPNVGKSNHRQHREMLSYFGQRVYCDVIGKLTPSMHNRKKCSYILTIQDGFTRYLVAVPLPDQQTDTVVDAIIHHWVYVFGCMETLHTDRGTNFTSSLFSEVMKRLGIVKTVTPPYSPEGDRVERAHRVLGDVLRADDRFASQQWTAKLPAAVIAYNGTVNRMTGVSPFEAVFHRRPVLPVDLLFPLDKPEGRSMSTHVENLRLQLSKMCEAMTQKQAACFARENKKHQARTQTEFGEGDTCYYFLSRSVPDLSRKLQCHWIGPFEVKRVVSESLVVIYPIGSWCKHPKEIPAIVNRLRKTTPELPTAGQAQFGDVDLQQLIEEQDAGAEHVTYSALEPDIHVELEEEEAEEEESKDIPLFEDYDNPPAPTMDQPTATRTVSPSASNPGEPGAPAESPRPPPSSEASLALGSSLGSSPLQEMRWVEPRDNMLPSEEENIDAEPLGDPVHPVHVEDEAQGTPDPSAASPPAPEAATPPVSSDNGTPRPRRSAKEWASMRIKMCLPKRGRRGGGKRGSY